MWADVVGASVVEERDPPQGVRACVCVQARVCGCVCECLRGVCVSVCV